MTEQVRDTNGRPPLPSAPVTAVAPLAAQTAVATRRREVESWTSSATWTTYVTGLAGAARSPRSAVSRNDRRGANHYLRTKAEQSDARAPVTATLAPLPAAPASTTGAATCTTSHLTVTAEHRATSGPTAAAAALPGYTIAAVFAAFSLPARKRNPAWTVRAAPMCAIHAVGPWRTGYAGADAALTRPPQTSTPTVRHRHGLAVESLSSNDEVTQATLTTCRDRRPARCRHRGPAWHHVSRTGVASRCPWRVV